ncbi:MAG: phosphatase PAP2 family protein [Oscillospiraceae bacterium]|nr:phosphatase PAP2 family protein [Oscillospiraceae bacterium]
MDTFLAENLQFLHCLVELRSPLLDRIMLLITRIGEESVFLLIAIFVFWCVDKRKGYYLLSVGFFGTVINQFLKITVRIPRPWVLDPSLTVVEGAREAATGYSFPSGHTQSIVGTMGGVARFTKRLWLRALCTAAIFAVAFSRLYLGVHTPLDVAASLLIGAVLVFALYPTFLRADEYTMRRIFLFMLVLSMIYLLYVELWQFPAGVDAENLSSAVKNAYTLFGALLGVLLAYYLDTRFIDFRTEAVWWAQLLKLTLGLALVLAVKSGLKAPLAMLFGDHCAAHTVRYFATVLAAGTLWPMTFAWFARLGRK